MGRQKSGTAASLAAVLSVLLFGHASAQPPVETGAGPDAVPFLGGERTIAEIESQLARDIPRRFRQVGTSSVTLRIDFQGASAAAFKPRTRSHPRGFQAEIAAYRVARMLGMDNVPPVVPRQLPRPLLDNRFESDDPSDWEPLRREILWDSPGVVRGATIYWVPSLERSSLDTVSGLQRAADWLRVGGALPDGAAAEARDLSTMIAFDYLIGNWDRFSGGNVSSDGAGRLYVRDHNVAFQAPLNDARYTRVQAHLERVQRFSRGFVERVEALDQASLEGALRISDGQASLLVPAQIDELMERRLALLSYVGGLVSVHGAEDVLVWE
ncbi:MAG: hypothetical protein AB8I08_12200 [Sandaracinaceae bacterium]